MVNHGFLQALQKLAGLIKHVKDSYRDSRVY